VVAGGHNVNAEIKRVRPQRWSDAESRSGILAVGDDKIDGVLL